MDDVLAGDELTTAAAVNIFCLAIDGQVSLLMQFLVSWWSSWFTSKSREASDIRLPFLVVSGAIGRSEREEIGIVTILNAFSREEKNK